MECQLVALKNAHSKKHLDHCLSSLPKGLDETYDQILCNINSMYVEDVKRFLTVLCASNQVLTVDQLLDAHAVDLSEQRYDRDRLYSKNGLLEACRGLIECEDHEWSSRKKGKIARIAHFSVQEYLESEHIMQRNAKHFAVRKELASSELAQICLLYLMQPELPADTDCGEDDDAKLGQFPLARFAAENWFHFFSSAREPQVEKLVLRLFKDEPKSFVAWKRNFKDLDIVHEGGTKICLPTNDEHPSPLYCAAGMGLEYVTKSVIDFSRDEGRADAVIKAKGGLLGNALGAASHQGQENVVQFLLDAGADVNARGGIYGNALQAASRRGKEQIVHTLLTHGANVNSQGGVFGTALQAASAYGHQKIVQILLDHGADVNIQAGLYSNALDAASVNGHEGILKTLLDQGAAVNAQRTVCDGKYNMASAAIDLARIQCIVNRGTVLTQTSFYGSGLQAASHYGEEGIVQMLLKQGADVNARGGMYSNSLQVCVSLFGFEKMVGMIIEGDGELGTNLPRVAIDELDSIMKIKKSQATSSRTYEPGFVLHETYVHEDDADIDSNKAFSLTPEISWSDADYALWIGVNQGRIVYGNIMGSGTLQKMQRRGISSRTLRIDFNHGSIIYQMMFHGDALQAASYAGKVKILQMLLDNGANVNADAGSFGTALTAASYRGHRKIVEMLLDRGAKLTTENESFSPALDAALVAGNEEVVNMLIDHGARLDGYGFKTQKTQVWWNQ